MITGSEVRTCGQWSDAADTITLDETARHRRRMAMVSDGGIAFLLDLAQATLLDEGDAILLDDGRLIAVRVKPEALCEVSARDSAHLLLIAWHLGNRHVPVQIFPDRLLLRHDPALSELLQALGATVREIEAAFHPDAGVTSSDGRPQAGN